MKARKKVKTAVSGSSVPFPRSRRKVEWTLLSGDELDIPGATLINLILMAGTHRGIPMGEIADQALGISTSYFHALRKGERPVPGLGDECIAKAAEFLRMPVVSVLLAAGKLKIEDFYAAPATVEEMLMPALMHIQQDPEFGPLLPASILKADAAIQKCVILLYERARGRVLISSRVTNEAIVERHRSLIKGANNAG